DQSAGIAGGVMVECSGSSGSGGEGRRKRERRVAGRGGNSRICRYWSLESVFLLFSAFSTDQGARIAGGVMVEGSGSSGSGGEGRRKHGRRVAGRGVNSG
nr:hypothetical protein [Tanacetum cinerariifolium]